MLNCRETSQLLSRGQDTRLSLKERLSLGFHLFMCGACQRFARQLRLLRKTAATLETIAQADGCMKLTDPARKRIEQAMRSAGFDANTRHE